MLAAFVFSMLGNVTDAMGLGDKADYVFNCSNSTFFVVRNENQLSGQKTLELKGTLQTPQVGYAYRFQFLTVENAQAYAILSVGQPVNAGGGFGRGLPAITQMQVDQKFNVPDKTGLLRIRVEGLSPQPTEFTCDLTDTSPQPQEEPDDRFKNSR